MKHRGWGVRLYVLVLGFLPQEFRDRHAAEMVRLFEEMWRERHGLLGGLRITVAACVDVLRRAWIVRSRPRAGAENERSKGGDLMGDVAQDLRYAGRQLLLHPAFTVILVVTLALGIGANTAVFSVVDGVLLRPLPYPHPDRLTVVWTQFPTMDLMEFPASWPEYRDYQDASSSYQALGLWGRTQRTLTGDENPERLSVAYFTWTMFDVLGVEPALGRVFTADEDVDGRDNVVVLSHGLWQRRFGSDPTVVGRTIQLDGRAVTVLGVMPSGFSFPDRDTQAWIPVGIDPANPPGRANHFGRVLGRLAPGVTLEQARTELHGLIERWQDDASLGHTWSLENHPAFLRPLRDDMVGDVRRSLFILLGAVGLVLLIACANVANLLLVRGEGRMREISIRAAMGAGRGRIVRQLVTESLLTAALGAGAGLLLAHFGLRALLALAPSDLPRADDIGLNGTVLAFSLALTVLAGFLFGLAPALQTLRMDVQGSLREEGRGGTAGRGRFRLRQLLVVGQTALAAVLLIAAGLLVQSFWRLQSVDPGFRDDRILAFSVSLPQSTYPEDRDVTSFYRDLMTRLSALPGVTAAGLVRTAPLTGSLPPNDIQFEGRPRTENDGPPLNADVQAVSAGYFATLGIPVLQGRVFDNTDNADSEPVAVVDEVLARRFFDDPSRALGERIRQSGTGWARIIGIVGAVHQESLADAPRAQLYLLHAQTPTTWVAMRAMTVLLRTGVAPLGMVSAVRKQVSALDPNLPVYRVTTMAETVARSISSQRFTMFLQLLFAVLALALALVGIYGVLSYSVAQRTREIGIRMALGAERGGIVRLVVRQGVVLTAIAVGIGVVGALITARVLASLLFGVSPHDPATYVAVVAMVVGVSLVASWLPARRASSVSPQTALRGE